MTTRRPVSAQVAALIVTVLLLAVVTTGPGRASGAGGSDLARQSSSSPDTVHLPRVLAAARRQADSGPGRVAFALALPDGRVYGSAMDTTFPSASLSKSLLAVALLRSAWVDDPRARADGELMIRASDNAAADRVLARLGVSPVQATADAAGMSSFRIQDSWAEARVSARDFALLLLRAPALVPARQRSLLRSWLGGIVPAQRWGIPAALKSARTRVLFKGGWRPGAVHQAARVERGDGAVGLAVLTDGGPDDMGRQISTIERVARALGQHRGHE